MYDWNSIDFPTTGLFDSQVYINQKKDIYKYDLTNNLWKKYDNARLEKTESLHCGCGMHFFTENFLNYIGQLRANEIIDSLYWDRCYNKSFLHIHTPDFTQNWYVWGLTFLEAETWKTNLPNDGTYYTIGIDIDVYNVIDPEYTMKWISACNSLYAVAKGRKSYYRKKSRPIGNAGVDTGFHNVYWANPYNDFGSYLLGFFGEIPVDGTNNEKAIWFSNPKNTYNQPKTSSVIKALNDGGYVYDTTTKSFVVVNGVVENLYVGNPMVIMQRAKHTNLRSLNMIEDLKGNAIIRYQTGVLMIYPLFSEDSRYRAFLLKPLGVDQVDFHFNAIDFDIFSKVTYKDSYNMKYVYLTPNLLAMPTNDQSGIINIYDTFYPKPTAQRINDKYIPIMIQFFSRNPINGVRGDISKSYIKTVKNKVNAELCFVLKK